MNCILVCNLDLCKFLLIKTRLGVALSQGLNLDHVAMWVVTWWTLSDFMMSEVVCLGNIRWSAAACKLSTEINGSSSPTGSTGGYSCIFNVSTHNTFSFQLVLFLTLKFTSLAGINESKLYLISV